MLRYLLSFGLGLVFATTAQAQDFPDKPITLVVPYAAGGAGDTIARPTAERLSKELGVQVIVENAPGAQGVIGTEKVVRSAADGYTIGLQFATMSAQQFFAKSVPYDVLTDIVPIYRAGRAPQVLALNTSIPVTDVKDFVEYARSQPNPLSYGSTGLGNPPHLAGELFQQLTGIKLNHIPYEGGGPVLVDLLGGQIPMAFMTLATIRPNIEAKTVKALAVLEASRSRLEPDIPTLAEGGVENFAIPDTWVGFIAPAGVPEDVKTKLYDAFVATYKDPEIAGLLEKAGYEVEAPIDPAQFAEVVKKDVEVYRKIAQDAGLTGK